jgi:hypothetical protein
MNNFEINSKKFLSTSGMRTTYWGPNAWNFLFVSILGTYPEKINNNDKNHIRIKKEFKNLFNSLGYIMPCIYCRDSYKQFIKEMPVENSMSGRIELFTWLYNLKDKVNNKLIKQEKECFNTEKKKLDLLLKNNKINKIEYNNSINNVKEIIFITKKSPSLIQVLKKYEVNRASCSTKSKTCR